MFIFKTLADMDFANVLHQHKPQTVTGKSFLESYQAYCITHPVSCNLVNKFLKEAKNYLYDGGVSEVYDYITDSISRSKYSWAIASVCESINNDNSKGNYLNKRAAEQVIPLLDMPERDVVDYIKSGAFKSVMYVEAFRNIARSIYRDQPILETNSKFSTLHPISITEKHDDTTYFEVCGEIYKIKNESIDEAKVSEVSHEFIQVSKLLESNYITSDGDNIILTLNDRTYIVKESNQCNLKTGERNLVLNTDQLRENSNVFLTTVPITLKNKYAEILESFAKILEKYDDICILDNASIISTSRDKFLVIENRGQAYAKMLKTTHTHPWKISDNIVEACKEIKKYTNVDLTESYKTSINDIIEQVAEEEATTIEESLKQEQVNARRQKVSELIEKFKNDPVRLHILSQIASDINNL